MVKTDTIIIGQGLCGTWLSWWLDQLGHDFIVIDNDRPQSSSRIASGVINPVTGRAIAETWMADQLLQFCLENYTAFGDSLGIHCIETVDILHSFPTAQMRDAFDKRLPQLPAYLTKPEDNGNWENYFYLPFGLGIIYPALLIDLNLILSRWQKKLRDHHKLHIETFDRSVLDLSGGKVVYKDFMANRIIFCDGYASMQNPLFNRLPFAANKGEALLLKIADLPATHIYKRGLSLVPFPHAGERSDTQYFWAGSTYDNEFTDEGPTEAFRKKTEQQISNWLKLPFTVVDHWAAIRPATIERRPFAGMHPVHEQVGILNGTGTKGCSLAPWFGKQLAEHLVNGAEIHAEASLERFSRILSV